MRAKIVMAAMLLLSGLQPVLADDLVRDVHETLYRPVHHGLLSGLFGGLLGGNRCITQPAVIAAPCAARCDVITEPAVVAPTTCGTAIMTRDPFDLDMRREQLQRKIAEAAACGRLNACQVSTLNAALAEVGQAEVCMRSQGELSNFEARRLYRAMDRIGAHADRWGRMDWNGGLGLGSLIGVNPGLWY